MDVAELYKKFVESKESFFYGMEQSKPVTPFLFYRYQSQCPDIQIPKNNLQNNIFSIDCKTDINITSDPNLGEFKKTIKSMIFAVIENSFFKVSTFNYECTVCGKTVNCNDREMHILKNHVEYVLRTLENNAKLFDIDDDDFECFFSKMVFNQIIQKPSMPFVFYENDDGHCNYNAAPLITNDDDLFTADDDINIEYKGEKLVPLSFFMTSRVSHLLPTEIVLPSQDSPQVEILENPTSIPEKENKEISQHVAIRPSSPITEEIIQEFLDKKTTTPKKERQKPLKKLSYFSTIPNQYHNEIISNISKDLIYSYLKYYLPQIIRSNLLNRKKEYQKKLREEKQQKQRDEELRRINEMKKQKEILIQKLSFEIASHLIRSFIHSDVNSIYKKEFVQSKEKEKVVDLPKTNENLPPPPVVLSGLYDRKYLNSKFIRKLFSGYKFEVDKNKEPKIYFRYNENRCDVLLYFSSYSDVRRALSKTPLQVECSTAFLSIEEDKKELSKTYNNQSIIISYAKNMNHFDEKENELEFIKQSPLFAMK